MADVGALVSPFETNDFVSDAGSMCGHDIGKVQATMGATRICESVGMKFPVLQNLRIAAFELLTGSSIKIQLPSIFWSSIGSNCQQIILR